MRIKSSTWQANNADIAKLKPYDWDMKACPLLIALLGFAALVQAANGPEGETLITRPMPFEYLYEIHVKQGPGWISRRWQSKEHGRDDTYIVDIFAGQRQNLAKFRESQDKPGKLSCGRFSSVVLDRAKRNGYKSVLWRTNCQVNGKEIITLQLGIDGRDSLYHMRKLWKIPVSAGIMESWKTALSEISLCDTRKKKQACRNHAGRARAQPQQDPGPKPQR